MFEKLIEEHARLIDKDSEDPIVERVADMVVLLVAIAKAKGFTEEEVIAFTHKRREDLGSLDRGIYLADGAA